MKPKYNCNNTLDYEHEFNRMCDTFHCSSDCPLCVLPCGAVKNITPEHINRVQAWSDAHPEITLTGKQVEIRTARGSSIRDIRGGDVQPLGDVWILKIGGRRES